MEPVTFSFSTFTLVGVIMLVLAGTSFAYLLSVRDKSNSSKMMLWFFQCIIFSAICTILTNSGLPWDWALAPAQDAFIMLGGVFLVRFIYWYPQDDQPEEARRVFPFFLFLTLVALGYSLFFFFQYLSNLPAETNEIQAYYLLTPLGIAFMVGLFFRRSIHWSNRQVQATEAKTGSQRNVFQTLLNPRNFSALALRNFGLALALGLLPVVITISKNLLPPVIASFLFNFGAVAAIAVIMLVYLNHAPEPSSVSVKLVGITLVIMSLLLGLVSVLLLLATPQEQVHNTVARLISLVLLSSGLVIFLLPIFFRSTLLRPLNTLLDGVQKVEAGNLDIQVEVQFYDEIGQVTRSFNQMIVSLRDATQSLKNESAHFEREVEKRTAELQSTNQQLVIENKRRKLSEETLDRQLKYEQALANCSQTLLSTAEDEVMQRKILTQSIEHLRAGASASRAYIFRNFHDLELGSCLGMIAETCDDQILPQIHTPSNQRIPWTFVPEEMLADLQAGKAYGGPTEIAFLSKPELAEIFLHQTNPLLSVQCFPITNNEGFWGFIGFDECKSVRDWDEKEISMLRTAAEMIGSTLKRWQAEVELRETLAGLEARVQERTLEFAQANVELNHEIIERQRFQKELEEHLEIEKILAKISARLLISIGFKRAIQETLADFGMVLQASRVIFYQLSPSVNDTIEEVHTWSTAETEPLNTDLQMFAHSKDPWFREQFGSDQAVYIPQMNQYPDKNQLENHLILDKEIVSLLLYPIFSENQLAGLIYCTNPKLPPHQLLENIQTGEVIARMFGSLITREALLNSLEEKVSERTLELSTFFDLAMLSAESRELSDIMQPALEKIIEINSCDAATIYIIEKNSSSLKLVALNGFINTKVSTLKTLGMDNSILGWINNLDELKQQGRIDTQSIPEVFCFPEFKNSTHVSLRARGKAQGILSCYRQADHPFNAYQVTLLLAIGEQLGMAVENYRLRLHAEEIAVIQERQRLARELHDAVSQSLYSLMLFAHSGRDALESGDQNKLLENLTQVETNSLTALKEMRLLLYQLRSFSLETGGLEQAIETRFNLIERRSGIQAEVHIDPQIHLNHRVEHEFFRLITEALNNSLKHAGANHVAVQLGIKHQHVQLIILDDGCGFDPSQPHYGMGLQNMRERAAGLKGSFDLASQPSKGTRVSVTIPLDNLLEVESQQGGLDE